MIHAKGCKISKFNELSVPVIDAKQIKEEAVPADAQIYYTQLFNPVEDQGVRGYCVAFGTLADLEAFHYKRKGVPRLYTSKAAQFWLTKEFYEPSDYADDGLTVSDGFLTLMQHGYVLDKDFPYGSLNADPIMKPPNPDLIHNDFLVNKINAVACDPDSFDLALYKNGPIVIGSNWYNEWENIGADGKLPTNVTQSIGGHCTVIVARKRVDGKRWYKGRNSWSAEWGQEGYYWMCEDSISSAVYDAYTTFIP